MTYILDRAPAGSGARHRGVLPPHRRGLRRGGRQRLAAQRPRDGPLLKAHPWRGEEHRQDPRSSSETMRFFLQNERVFSNVLYFFWTRQTIVFFVARGWGYVVSRAAYNNPAPDFNGSRRSRLVQGRTADIPHHPQTRGPLVPRGM